VEKFAKQYGKEVRGLTPRAWIVLSRHSWPGNVRELDNVMGHACMMAMAETIDIADLPDNLRRGGEDRKGSSEEQAPARQQLAPVTSGEPLSLEEHEKQLLKNALDQAQGNQSVAARHLRIGRDALRYKMKKYGLL